MIVFIVVVAATVAVLALGGAYAGWSWCEHQQRDEDERVRAAALRAAQEIAMITLSAREQMHRIVGDASRRGLS